MHSSSLLASVAVLYVMRVRSTDWSAEVWPPGHSILNAFDDDPTILTSILGTLVFRFRHFFKVIALLPADLKAFRTITIVQLMGVDGQMTVLTSHFMALPL
jgi:hypothetical protein